jgi:hypothetical protein
MNHFSSVLGYAFFVVSIFSEIRGEFAISCFACVFVSKFSKKFKVRKKALASELGLGSLIKVETVYKACDTFSLTGHHMESR